MNPDKRKALEAAGWKTGDAADFLEMTPEERAQLDKTLTFPRTGKPPLVCTGEVVARAASRTTKGNLAGHWHELTLVRTDSGRLVVAVQYGTTWPHETPHAWAEVCEDPNSVPPALDRYDPIQGMRGYPPGKQFATKQKVLLAEVQQGYYAAVGRLLAEAGIVERV